MHIGMKKRYYVSTAFIVLALGTIAIISYLMIPIFTGQSDFNGNSELPMDSERDFRGPMLVQSSAFKEGERISATYTCKGENINPPISIEGVPQGAKSLAFIVDDPDAPRGLFTHWTVWNIRPDVTEIPENSVPDGAVQGITTFGRAGYGGPCPPTGTHRYFFTAYALDISLDLSSDASRSNLESKMQGHILDQGRLMGMFSNEDSQN
jgi:Raf kinase inhibitor-like YbhB/YbcL family protein